MNIIDYGFVQVIDYFIHSRCPANTRHSSIYWIITVKGLYYDDKLQPFSHPESKPYGSIDLVDTIFDPGT
jgi:hypothetical protein